MPIFSYFNERLLYTDYIINTTSFFCVDMKVLLLLAAAAVASVHGDGIPVYGKPPVPHHGPVHYDESPKPFAYQYGVSDSYTGNKLWVLLLIFY